MISFAELVSGKKSRAEAPPSLSGPRRADRVTKPASTRQGAKASSAAAGEARQARPGSPNRWAHFAGMTPLAPIADRPVITDINPTDAAAFVMASAAKARGQKVAAPAKPRPPIKADMTTPESIAAFVAASAAKCRGPSR